MRLLPTSATLLLCTLATAGAHAASTPQGNHASKSVAPIVNGTEAADIPEHRAVVALHVILRDGNQAGVSAPFCTGTLISDTVVLTAAHCVEENPATGLPPEPEDLLIYVGDDPAVDDEVLRNLYRVEEIAMHSDYNRNLIINDIAVLVLEEPVPVAPIPPLPRVIGITEADIGARLNFAGFGQDEGGQSGRKLQTDGVLGGTGCAVTGCFDAGDPITQFSYAMEETGPCFGDSGGPAFIYRGGRPYLAGVTSYGDEECSLYGVSTRVDAYMEWVNEFIGVDLAPPSVTITSPGEAAAIIPGSELIVVASDDENVVRMDLYIDNVLTQTLLAEPWVFAIDPALPQGEHTFHVVAYDSANSASATMTALVEPAPSSGGCAATGGATGSKRGGGLVLLALAVLLAIRRSARAAA